MPHSISTFALPLAVLPAVLLSTAATAAGDLAGRYEIAEGPDAAGGLELKADGHFAYALSIGALDERAQGRWAMRNGQACLTTQPTPRSPEFKRVPPREDQTATVRVEDGQGEGVAGIDVVVGFDAGEPDTGYTQYYGWSLPEDETRVPRWIELSEPINRFASPRLPLAPADKGRLRAVIVPNDLGIPDFRNVCLEAIGGQYLLHRKEGDMTFKRVDG